MQLTREQAVAEAYDYMRIESAAVIETDIIFVFCNGSEQQLLAEKTAEIHGMLGGKALILCSGGIGRGSVRQDAPESILLREQLVNDFHISKDSIIAEAVSRNAGENCRNGMALIRNKGLDHGCLALVGDAFAMRRLKAVFELEASLAAFETDFSFHPTDRKPRPGNPEDEAELLSEILKVADWPNHTPKWSQEQVPPPPQVLIEYARNNVVM